MRRLRAWAAWFRWEMGRRIELDGVIKLIILDRVVKAAALVGGGVVLIAVGSRSDLHHWADEIQVQLGLEPDRGLWSRLVGWLFSRLGAHPVTIGVVALLYGLLEGVEGIGLLLRRRWAEYLVVLATSAFLPLEVSEVLRHPSPLKAAALLVNAAIVAYLGWRKRLFLERPGHVSAAAVS
jgi:uncharacterized membrane protein (DUF2068 family)